MLFFFLLALGVLFLKGDFWNVEKQIAMAIISHVALDNIDFNHTI